MGLLEHLAIERNLRKKRATEQDLETPFKHVANSWANHVWARLQEVESWKGKKQLEDE